MKKPGPPNNLLIRISFLCLLLASLGLFLQFYLRPNLQGLSKKDSEPWKFILNKTEEGESRARGTLSSDFQVLSGPALLALGRKIDINHAEAEDLAALPGLGLSTAQQIVEDRRLKGPFEKIEDLMRVAGIKEKKFVQIRDYVTTRP